MGFPFMTRRVLSGATENRVPVSQFDIDHKGPFDDPPTRLLPDQPVPIHAHTFVGDVRVLAGTDMQYPGLADRGGSITVDIDDMVAEQVLGGATPVQEGPDHRDDIRPATDLGRLGGTVSDHGIRGEYLVEKGPIAVVEGVGVSVHRIGDGVTVGFHRNTVGGIGRRSHDRIVGGEQRL